MQGEDIQVNQMVALAALALMLGVASYLGAAYSPKSNPGVGNPEEKELLREFSQLNPEAQRGAIRYIKEMRKGYQKDLTKIKS